MRGGIYTIERSVLKYACRDAGVYFLSRQYRVDRSLRGRSLQTRDATQDRRVFEREVTKVTERGASDPYMCLFVNG